MMRIKIKSSLKRMAFLLPFLVLVGCGGDGLFDSNDSITLRGVIFESDGKTPVPDVAVLIEEFQKSDVSNQSGGFEVEDIPNLLPFVVRFTSGNTTESFTFGDLPDDTAEIKLVLRLDRVQGKFLIQDIDYEDDGGLLPS